MAAFIYLLFSALSFVFADESILCTEQYCRDYGFEVGCGAVVQNCRISNSTHRGIELLSPTTCNCCEFCLAFILEGEVCSLGGPGDGVNVARCGPGLTCVQEDGDARCRRMESECHSRQDEYDVRHLLGEAGALEERPKCDDKTKFAPTVCVPTQTCFCQSEEGERIFGEGVYRDTNTPLRMQCGCSRRNYQMERDIGSALRSPAVGPRCDQDGGYLPVQCAGRECFCVNTITGRIVGRERVHLDTQSIKQLSCYDAELDLFPDLNSEHADANFNYTSPCQAAQSERSQLMLDSEEGGYIVDFYSSNIDCLPDGTYGRIRTDSDGRKTCINERGEQIYDHSITPGAAGYDEMDCKCALTSYLLRDRAERPVCCQNGNFRPIQCRRGACHCVDANGLQVSKETSDITTLSCYSDDWIAC